MFPAINGTVDPTPIVSGSVKSSTLLDTEYEPDQHMYRRIHQAIIVGQIFFRRLRNSVLTASAKHSMSQWTSFLFLCLSHIEKAFARGWRSLKYTMVEVIVGRDKWVALGEVHKGAEVPDIQF